MSPIMKKSLFYCTLLLLLISNNLTAQWPTPFNTILPNIQDSTTKKVLANPKTYRYQLVYTKIDRDQNGILATEVFSEQQTSDDVLKILGYTKKQ